MFASVPCGFRDCLRHTVVDRIRRKIGDRNWEVGLKSQVILSQYGGMNQRSEQLVLDYLSEVGLELHGRMTAQERTAYLAGVRSRIDARRAAAGHDVDTVRGILRGLGTPRDLVERDLDGRDLDVEDDELIPSRPRHADRPPPPWRGGPDRGIRSLLEGPGQTELRIRGRRADRGDRPGQGDRPDRGGPVAVLRRHPPEAAALLLLLLAVPWWWDLAFLWVLGAALILLSQVWPARDKWIGVGLPLLSCALGMALWSGEAEFVDEYVQESLTATGVIGLGAASLVCAVYLYSRLPRPAPYARDAAPR